MGNAMTDYDLDQEIKQAQDDKRRASDMAISLASGTKLPLDELAWYLKYCNRAWFGHKTWRNKSKQSIYVVTDTTLRVADGMGGSSPVYLYVTYSPLDNPGVRFSREANEFLRKFEPVYEAVKWERVAVELPSMPWNPAYHETYDAMTERERRRSFLFDLAVAAVCISVMLLATGCKKRQEVAVSFPGDTAPIYSYDAPVYVDRITGCQYIGYTSHGLAPRMEIRDGNYRQMGCEEIVRHVP